MDLLPFDLLFGGHRTVTHSITAVCVVAVVAGLIGQRCGHAARAALLCGSAWASHLLMDWLAVDTLPPRGIEALWPLSHAWFISGWDVFAGTERHHVMTRASLYTNARAIAREVVLLAPIVYAAWLVPGRRTPPAARPERHVG